MAIMKILWRTLLLLFCVSCVFFAAQMLVFTVLYATGSHP